MNILETSHTNRAKSEYLNKMLTELEEVLSRLAGAPPQKDGIKSENPSIGPTKDTVAFELHLTANNLDTLHNRIEALTIYLKTDLLAVKQAEPLMSGVILGSSRGSLVDVPETTVRAVARELGMERT